MVEQHLYQNVRLRDKRKSAASSSSKPTEPSDAEYSVVPQDWIQKKKKTTAPVPSPDYADTIPPPLPPRSELAEQLEDDKIDENMYDIPVVPKDKAAASDDKSMSSSSITVDNDLYQSSRAKGNTISSPLEKKAPVIPQVKQAASLGTSDATYDVIGDVPTKEVSTLPATVRHSASPEYAQVQQSPKITYPKPNLTSSPTKSPQNSPILSRPPPAREYDYISVASAKDAAAKVTVSESTDEYDRPVTAREHELRINSPPSPQLSHYAKLKDTKTSKKTDKQQWDLPKKSAKNSKKTRAGSVEAASNRKGSEKSDSVDEAIKELEKGLGSNARSSKSQSLYLSDPLDTEPPGDLSLDWDHSDMHSKHESAVQMAWMEKHKQMLVQRSYEDVDLPNNGTSSSPTVPDKLRRGWSPRGVDKDDGEKLPAGWSKVVGEDGVYYWHVKSGKTQWKPPKEGDASKVCMVVIHVALIFYVISNSQTMYFVWP